MKTEYPLVLVAAMAIAGLMLTMAGPGGTSFSDGVGTERANQQTMNELETTSQATSVANGNMPGGGVIAMVFLVITAAKQLFSIIMMVVLLPIQLRDLGFPAMFAFPVGLIVQIVASIGILQFLSGRVYR